MSNQADANTLTQLLDVETGDSALTVLLTQLASGSFPTTNWNPASSIYKILQAEAISLADQSNLIASIAKMGLLTLSSGPWLDLFGKSFFQVSRNQPLPTILTGSLSLAASAGAKTINPGGISVKNPSTGLVYVSTNTTTLTLNPGTSLGLQFQSQLQGASTLVGINPFSTLSILNPSPGLSFALSLTDFGTPFVQQGIDAETDRNYTTRLYEKWATIGLQKTSDAYVSFLMNTPQGTIFSGSAVEIPEKIFIQSNNPRGAGTANLLVFGGQGPLDSNSLNYYSQSLVLSQTICTDVQIFNVSQLPVTITGDVYYFAGFPQVPIQVSGSLQGVVDQLPIQGILYYSDLLGVSQGVPGVRNIENFLVNGGTSDITAGTITIPQVVVLQPLTFLRFHAV